MATVTDNNKAGNIPYHEFVGMSQNLIIRIDQNGDIYGKISLPRSPRDAIVGSVYIDGRQYLVSSYEFVKILPV